ncbi:MAG: class I SAM-dependent methyltransferase [Theionarchaea archaeon]|nr:class I SAM-dependent methyltransferase [Theionarchaea archaeon]
MNTYQKEIARFYDIIVHGQKEAEAGESELEFVEWAFQNVCSRKVNQILDVGCGNGRFLIPLVRKGYTVTGLDINQYMLEECSKRLKKQKLQADLIQKDLETMDFDSEYDALLCMDSVICYFLESERIINVLRTFRRALNPQGILIVENWNMPAHRELCEEAHVHRYTDEDIEIKWQEHDWYETFTSIFHIEVKGTILEKGEICTFHHEEILRAMTVGEMNMYLKEAGFIECSAYPSYDLSEAANVNGDSMIFLSAG